MTQRWNPTGTTTLGQSGQEAHHQMLFSVIPSTHFVFVWRVITLYRGCSEHILKPTNRVSYLDGSLTGTTALGQGGPWCNSNEKILHTPQSSPELEYHH